MQRLEQRIGELADTEAALAQAEDQARALEASRQAAARAVEEQRAAWVREKEYAQTKRTELLTQYEDVKEQRDKIAQLGPQGECPTCRRPLGEEHSAVLGVLDRQLQAIVEDGKYFRQRLDQLEDAPPAVVAAEAARDALREESRRASERAGELRARAGERKRAGQELETARERAAAVERQRATRRTGYDVAHHDAVRASLLKLEPVALEAASLEERAARASALVSEAETAERNLSEAERRVRELADALAAEGYSEKEFGIAKDAYDRALGALRESELGLVEARGELARAESDVREAGRREEERAAQERHIAVLKTRQRLHNELDRGLSDLRADLNAAMRPEISEIASGFLADLTDDRYHELELNEDYEVTVLDEGVPKPVISGGEEDLASLVLRLAISQMIAARAGQPLSLLVLDEIFGSLDEGRRQHVVGLLRRLADRFPQVILITHIEQVREGLDRVIRVDFDPARGTSVVRDDTATLGAADAGVAA
jgi:exonuclease SbcC